MMENYWYQVLSGTCLYVKESMCVSVWVTLKPRTWTQKPRTQEYVCECEGVGILRQFTDSRFHISCDLITIYDFNAAWFSMLWFTSRTAVTTSHRAPCYAPCYVSTCGWFPRSWPISSSVPHVDALLHLFQSSYNLLDYQCERQDWSWDWRLLLKHCVLFSLGG